MLRKRIKHESICESKQYMKYETMSVFESQLHECLGYDEPTEDSGIVDYIIERYTHLNVRPHSRVLL